MENDFDMDIELIPVIFFDDEFIEDSMTFDSAGRDIDDFGEDL